ncbi:MAG: hypothetical protein KDK23_14355, partial [Leptospiraceae bacterium]|nr:hypothetical protein [Leptospiraceae bacterium]
MINRTANLAPYLAFLFLFFCHQPSEARTLYADPFQMLRAGRWAQILRYFESREPRNKSDYYALARAIEKSKGHAGLDAIAPFLNVVRSDCMPAATEASLNQCLESVPEDSVRDLLERLALFRAQEAATKTLSQTQREKILARANLKTGDVLDQKILQKRLDLLLEMKRFTDAARVAERYAAVSGDYTEFLKARSFREAGLRDRARDYYFKAAEMSPPA